MARIPLSLELATLGFKETWGDGYLLSDLSTKLTCTEFEALADMLLAIGVDPQTVEYFEQSHAEGDECGDMHHQCPDCPSQEEMDRTEAESALAAWGVDPEVLDWVQNGQGSTRFERLQAGEIKIADIINEEKGLA